MATQIERDRAKEKALHDKLDKILEAINKRNFEEAKKIVGGMSESKKSKATKKTS